MLDTTLSITTPAGTRTVSLADYITADAEEDAHRAAYAWIKGLRHLFVDGMSFRERFTARGDSLWWFSEVYLHKTRTILDIHRAIAGLRELLERERPAAVTLIDPPAVLQHVASQLLARRRIGGSTPVEAGAWQGRLRSLELHARRLNFLARIAPDRFRRAPARGQPAVAAFIHRAFWKSGGDDGSAETYIGPVLRELEARLGTNNVHYIGVGPSTHFRAHRPWRLGAASPSVLPVERYAPRRSLAQSQQVWHERRANLSAMEGSIALRNWAVIGEVDCWPLVREQLAGIAWLQWPWSVRSMDEAAAALDILHPRVAVTYAEAGGWGRALILEARRRGIPTVGLQHGFIYRHWLNYLHEPDEMDEHSGYPRPTRTLLFDEYARNHLRSAGNFPGSSLIVTGSPRLDALVRSARNLSPEVLEDVRRRTGAEGHILLVTTKEREARAVLPALVEAAGALTDVTVVIKPHPAEDAGVYANVARGRATVRLVEAAEPLGPLLAVARAVVTVNSTVALDAAVLGVPALSLGLPNNLSPFVEAGAIAGSASPVELPHLLRAILYDEGFRQQLAERSALIVGAGMEPDGGAAARAALAIQTLASPSDRPERERQG
jgi:hypothetical protein